MTSFINRINKKIYAIYKFVKMGIHGAINKKTHICRIEEINISKKIIVIHCRGIDAPIKMRFDELVNDSIMLSALSPKHAAWIGYYYGIYYCDLLVGNKFCDAKFDFSLDDSQECFRIVMLNRRGDIIYTDEKMLKQ
jgi:hypothetical protein